MRRTKKPAIALLITLMFIISITVAIGISLKQVHKVQKSVSNEKFIIQTSILIDDVLNILKTSKELSLLIDIEDEEKARLAFFIFLEQAAFIPFESSGIEILIEIRSGRSKFNPNVLVEHNATVRNMINDDRVGHLKEYLNMKRVDYAYTDILLDSMSGIKEDFSYFSEIFIDNPYLFRDHISSLNHLEEINKFYLSAYHNVNIQNIDSENLYYFSQDLNSSYRIDLNHATKETFELLLLCSEERAQLLSENFEPYNDISDLALSNDEANFLADFNTSVYEPYLDVQIEFIENKKTAIIRFEYDILEKKGSNFVYEI